MKQTFQRTGLGIAALGVALVLIYSLLGHGLIRAMYESDLSIFAQIMRGKAVTPLQAYFVDADLVVLKLGLGLVLTGALWWLFFKNPVGIIYSGMSFLIGSFVVFFLLDQFPVLVKPLRWDIIPNFNSRLTYVPDAVFGFREKPYNRSEITNFRGSAYSPLYGIDVPMSTIRWQVDGEGFRNKLDTSVADIAIIGSSFSEYGDDFEDTYPRQLEKKLAGPKVVNLAKAGYGPFQYLQLLKSYAVKKKVRFVVITFHPSSDTELKITEWLNKGVDVDNEIADGIYSRYRKTFQQAGKMLFSGGWTALQLGFRGIVGTDFIHPDVAILRLPNGASEKLLLLDQHSTRSVDNLLESPEWNAWRLILVALKELSEENQIVPLLLYIPAVTEIYSEYITPQSGKNWLQLRESLIATQRADEEAARRLAANVGIEMISLRSAFEQAARQGKLVYYPLDMHWNRDGRKIAASVTAEALRALLSEKRGITTASATQTKPRQEVAFDSKNNSLMERKITGEIKFWNQRAEGLYGWTKEEAIGKVSHALLRTEFPKSLEQINGELLRDGRWQGKLVHATRDGRRIEVASVWMWDPRRLNYDVVEINKRSPTFE